MRRTGVSGNVTRQSIDDVKVMNPNQGTVLIVDDEPAIRCALRPSLVHAGFAVAEAESGEDALDRLHRAKVDVMLLDLMLPGLCGIDVCRIAREDHPRLPILMLTVETSEDRVVEALDAGADDYIIKPFHVRELLARIRSTVRRSRLPDEDGAAVISIGAITLDPARRAVHKNGHRVYVTPKEFAILQLLMLHAGKTVSHTKLLQNVWGPEYGGELEYLRTFIRRLRMKLEDDPADPLYLVSDWRSGYRFAGSSAARSAAARPSVAQRRMRARTRNAQSPLPLLH